MIPDPASAGVAPAPGTVIDLLRQDRRPDTPVLIFEDGLEMTHVELRDAVERAAGYLRGLVSARSTVAILMENRAEYLISCLAIIALRAAFLPVNPASGRSDGVSVLRTARATTAIVDEASLPTARAWQADLPDLKEVVVVRGPEPHGLSASGDRLDLATVACETTDVIAVALTSGTTGLPKGCMVDHVWALRTTQAALRIHPYGPDDRIFYPVKFHYLDGFNALLRALRCGGAYVAARKFSVSRYWDVVRRHRVTILSTIASMPVWLLKADPDPLDRKHSVRFGIQAHIPPALHEALDRRWGFPWLENYGMMEAGVIARVPLQLADELRGSGSAGPPAPDRTVAVLGGDERPVRTGHVGEIVVQGPGLFRGYLDRPDATAELLRGGWLHTGDLGRIDDRGFVYVVGRIKDVIRRSGENVSSEEVEMALRAHPGVADAAVIGVPDVDRGEELKAIIEQVQGIDVDLEELAAFCAERLAPHKVPRYFEVVESLPRNASMRVRKEVLRGSGPHAGRTLDRAAAARTSAR